MAETLPSVRAVFFDAVGTLIHPVPSAAEAYAEIGFHFGSRLDVAAIRRRFGHFFQVEEAEDRRLGLATSEERERRRWHNIVGGVLDDVADAEGCFTALYEHFARPTAWRCDPAAGKVLERLASLGYQLGLASNYDRRLRPVVAGLPEMGRIQHLVISSEVGWRKPAAGFFAAMCDSVKLPAEAILYVGDDRDNDFEGASRARMKALLLDPHGRHRDLGTAALENLEELGW